MRGGSGGKRGERVGATSRKEKKRWRDIEDDEEIEERMNGRELKREKDERERAIAKAIGEREKGEKRKREGRTGCW